MTINDIVWLMRNTERYQRGAAKPEYPNGAAVSHPDMPDDGLDITGMTAADRKIIPVSKEAEQAVYDRDYESASQMYRELGTLNITAYDEDGGDLTELGIEDMVSEKLVSLDLKQIAALTLYSIYQAYELPERIRRLYISSRGGCLRIQGWKL